MKLWKYFVFFGLENILKDQLSRIHISHLSHKVKPESSETDFAQTFEVLFTLLQFG